MRKRFFIVLPAGFLLIYLFSAPIFTGVKKNLAETNQAWNSRLQNENPEFFTKTSRTQKSPPLSFNSVNKSLKKNLTEPDSPAGQSGKIKTTKPDTVKPMSLISSSVKNPSANEADITESGALPLNTRVFVEGPAPLPRFSLQFINTQVLEPNLHFKQIPVGGLSALSYDPATQTFFALSDDKGRIGPPRFYEMQLSLKNTEYRLNFKNMTLLKNEKNQYLRNIDPEGMAFVNSNQIFISSEGAQMDTLIIPPGLFSFDIKGHIKTSMTFSSPFWPENLQQLGSFGVKENKAFEALSLAGPERELWLATEQSLHQDDEKTNTDENKKNYIRFSQIDLNQMKIKAQYVYPMLSYIEQGILAGKNGITDFLFLNNKQFIVVERAYLKSLNTPSAEKQDANSVRLFLTDCSQAEDVSSFPALQERRFVICGKTPLMNLSRVTADVDNIEGIVKGPETAKGYSVLILVSDNNFSPSQKNQFLFFHYIPDQG